MFRIFQHTIVVTGTLACDVDYRFILPFDAQLIHVSATQSDAHTMQIQVGDSSDPNEYLGLKTLSGSGTVDEYDGDDFMDSSGNTHSCYYPHITHDTTICVNVDYDYNAGEGSQYGDDLTIVLTFSQG